MLRHCPFQLAVVPMLLLVLVGCSGSDGDSSQDVQPDDTHDSVGADIITCPDGLVFYEEQGVCAPYIPECEAWEMPTVDGECVVVGPRACPKTWNPDADVDCEPGDLLPWTSPPRSRTRAPSGQRRTITRTTTDARARSPIVTGG